MHFDVIPTDPNRMKSVILAAAKTGVLWIFKLLLSKVAGDGQALTSDAYDVACEHNHLDIMRYILDNTQFDSYKAFVSSCKYGHNDIIREFLSEDCTYSAGMTNLTGVVLTRCADAKDIQFVLDLLIEKGRANPHDRDFWCDLGCGCATIPFIEHALSEWNATEQDIRSAILYMCRDGRIDALQFLLHWCSEHPARGPTLLATDHLCDLLQHALGQKQMLVVDLIFSRLGRSLPVPVEDSDTSSDALLFDKMLENAVKCSHREIVKILIDSGKCDVNREIRTYISDITLRHPLLSLAHDPAVVRLLLDAKAVVNREGCETVFQASCTQFSFDSVMMLLEANADVNGGGPWALSALQWAARAPCTDEQADEKADILELLIDAGANTIRMWKSDSILEMCMNSGTSANRVVTAQTLLANVPSLWIHGYWRETPLMLACKTYIRDPAQFRGLIDAGDDANARDKYGVSVLGYLFKHANNGSGVHSARKTREILHMLLDQGANPLLDATGNGCTVLMLIVLRATNCFGGNGADYPNAANTAFISDILEFILHHPDIHSLTVDDTVDDPPCLQQSKRAKRCRMGNAICGAVRGIADAVARLLG